MGGPPALDDRIPTGSNTMKLAIIVPAYNCAATIGDTLLSLQDIDKGWGRVERVVICDDASSDNTLSVIQSITFDRCPLTVVRHDSNKGEAACYNTMLNVLSEDTKWFLILHSDDIALACFLERNLEILRQCNERVAAISSNYYVFGRIKERLAHSPAEDTVILRGGAKADIDHTAMVGCWWHISGSLINKDLWRQFGGRNPTLPQVGDWDLILRWQTAGYFVGHSLIPTTKYRINGGKSVSTRSYIEFRDLQERASVILNYPAVFSCEMRRTIARKVGATALRRIGNLLRAGEVHLAVRGMSIGYKCVLSLMSDCNPSWSDKLRAGIYRLNMYCRWIIEFGFVGLWKLHRCDGSSRLRQIYLRSRRFGPIVCRDCQEDFAVINSVICFGAYSFTSARGQFGSVLDLGANIGIATRYLAARLPNISVLALEPYFENCELFKMNMATVGASDRVRLWQCAVGATGGRGYLKSGGTIRFDSFQLEYSAREEPLSSDQSVSVRALASVVEALPGPILLKMDIEGMEDELLACRADWINKVGRMMIEFHESGEEEVWLDALAAEGWKSEKHFDTWHFYK